MVNIVEQRRDPSTKDEDLAAIKDWLKKQPHLPDEWEDSCLLSTLRGCSFSLEKCKRKLDMYFTMRAACPEFFTNRDIHRPELIDIMKRSHQCTMPGLTPKGWRVSVTRGLDMTMTIEHLPEAMKILMMIADVRMREEDESVAGDVYIVDLAIAQPHHMMNLSVSLTKKIVVCVQEAYPIKLKEIHIVNVPSFMDTLYNLIKPLVKDKIKKRMFFHKDYNGMQEYIPKDMLPKDYGGTGPALDEVNKHWIDKLKEHKDWFKEQESLKANEALRPGKPKDYDEMFGIEGSFRQLAID